MEQNDERKLEPIEKLAKIIKEHPNCYLDIDNDHWELYSCHPPKFMEKECHEDCKEGCHECDDEHKAWMNEKLIAKSDDFVRGVWADDGNISGIAILFALAKIYGMVIQPA